MGPWGAGGARRAPRLGPPLPAAPVPRGASELRRQRSPPALHRGARPPRGHRGRSGRDGSGRDGTGRDGPCAPPGDAPPPPARPAPCGNRRRGYFCTWGERSGAGSVRGGHDWPRRAGPGPAPPHRSAPRRSARPRRRRTPGRGLGGGGRGPSHVPSTTLEKCWEELSVRSFPYLPRIFRIVGFMDLQNPLENISHRQNHLEIPAVFLPCLS